MSDIRLVKKGEDKLKNVTGFGVNRNAVKQMELTAKSSFETLQNYKTKLNNREYLSSDDLKSYKSAMNSYIENNNRLRKLNKIFGQGYTDVQENEWNDAIISLQSGYKEASDYFSQFKDVNEYNDTLAAIKQQETMRAEDQEKLRFQLEEKRHVYNYWNSIASNPVVKKGNINNESLFNPHISVSDSVEAVFDYFDPLKTKYNFDPNSNNDFIIPNTKKYLGEDQNDAKGILSQNQLDSGNLLNKVADAKYAGLTLGELKKQIEEDEKYLTQVRYLQNYFYITENDVSLDELKSHLSDEDPIAYTDPSGKNITWQKLYDDKKYENDHNALYSSLSSNEDWEYGITQSQNIENPTTAEHDGFVKIAGHGTGKKINNKATYARDNEFEIQLTRANGSEVGDIYKYIQMTDEEFEIYNYYLYKYGEGKAEEYFKSIEDVLVKRDEEEQLEGLKRVAEEFPVYASATSVLTSAASGLETIKDLGNYVITGEMDDNYFAQATTTIRNTVAEQVDWEIGNWDAFDFVYNTGMSMADSAVSMAAFGNAGGVALGLSAAGQATNDALDRGLSSKQAFWNGLASGTFEIIFETVSIGQFSALKESLGSGIKNIAKNIGKSMLVNASEETLTEIANIVYDTVMNTDFSNYETKIRAYVASGMTPEEAENQVKNEMTRQIAESAASGALMGFGFGGIGSVSSHINAKAIENAYSKADINNLINIGLSAPESKAYALAQQAQSKTNSGKLLSAQEIAALQQAVTEAVSNADISKIKQAVETRLIELGGGKAASAVAEIIAKQVAGQKLTSSEKSTLKNSKYGQRVVNEIAPENVASGEYSSEWGKSIGTNWINKNVYNRNLQSTANDEGDSISAVDTIDDGETTNLASGVVQGADGKQYFNDGSGDEYFGDAEGVDVAHGGDISAQGEVIDGGAFDLSEPTQKDIARAPTSQEVFDEAITGKQKTNIQRHIVDICKQLDSGITVEFVDGLETNGKFVRSKNKILIRSDLSTVQMYVEVFKHEFMHRLETKKLYGKFFDYCFKKSTAFEQYVRAELKTSGVDYNIDTATRVGVIEAYTKYKFDQYKNSKDIPKADRDTFTIENAQEEIVADFFAQILFQGEKYRTRIIEALGNADGEAFIGIGDEISSEAALLELQQKEPTLFEQVVQWIKDIIYKLRGMPQAKSLVEQLDNEINLLESMARRAYQSKDSKRLMKKKLDEIKFSLMNNNTFESNVDIVSTMNDADALQNKEEGNFVRVMYGTPTIVRDNVSDAENLDVIISFYSLYLATRKTGILEGHYHNLGSETIKKLPEYISNPDAIIRTNNDRLNLFVQISTAKGNNGILSIELNTVKDINNNYGKYNLVVTVFSAGDNYIKNNIIKNAKKIEYQKEDLMQVNPQLYEWLTIVNNKSSLNSIAEKEYIVNDEDSKRFIREKQNEVRYLTSEDADLYKYIKDALAGKLSKKSYYKSSNEISDRMAEDIEKICNELGIKVVFEDLREMVYKGEILSPDGYIEKEKGIIHINLYAQNPIGFVLKHELTHFGEKSDKYKAFVSSVKKSKHYERWISEKTGESDVRIAEYKYKQMVANTHSDIYGTADPKAEAEMIADFVGEMLFTENGSGMIALINDLNTKQRNVVIQYVLDFISYVKKKLSGITSITFELSRLEDEFIRLMADAVQEYDYIETENLKSDEHDISFCFVRCEDEDLIAQAEELEEEGLSGVEIFNQIGVYKNVFGEWAESIDLGRYRFYPYGNHSTGYNLIKKSNHIEGRLRDIVIWPELYEKFPEFEDVKIVIKPSDFAHDKTKFIPDENGGKIIINQKLCDDYVTGEDFIAKEEMVKAIQHMIQFKEGNYVGRSYDYWKDLEAKGKLPYLEKKGRYITADEMMHKFADNYDADMAARRQFVKYVKTNLDKQPDKYKQAALYQPYIDENDVIVYGGRNKLMTLYEKNNVKKRRLPNNYILNKNETDYEIYEVDEKGGSTQKVKEFVWSKEKKPTAEFRHNWGKIKGGNSGFLESLAMDFEKRFFNQKHIISNILTSDEDTIGRKLSLALQEKLDGSFAINESGQPISGYVVSLHGDDVFRQAGLGLPLSTIDAAIARYNDTGSVSGKNTNCFEFYMIAKRPFILYGDPQELSLKEIGLQLVQSGYLPEKEYLKMINSEYGKKPSTYNAYMTSKLRNILINEGFDSLIYENQRHDKGSITIAVFDKSQLIPVAKDGLLIENNGIEDARYKDYWFDEDPRFDGAKENKEKLAMYVQEPQYNLRTVRKQVDSRIKLGDAGFFEKLQSSAQEAYEYVCSELSKCGEIELSGYDNAGRKFTRKAFNTLQNCFFRDENGDIMIFSLWNTKIKNISQAAKMGIEFGTLNSALIKFFNHKESKGPCYNGVFEQFILNCSKPLVLPFDGWNAATVAEYLLEQGGISNKFYNKLLSLKSIGSSTYISDASQILREQIKMSGYDCIIFTKSTGEKAVIPFYDDLIIPISENGILKPECDIYENIISKTNDDVDGEVIKPKKVTVRDFSKVKDIILAEEDATKKLKHLTEFLSHASNSILSENNDINIGFSGDFDTIGQNLWKFVSICNNLLSDAARNIALNERDTADRFVQEEIRQELRDTKLKNENGRLLSFFFFDKNNKINFIRSSWGYHVTTLKGAHDMYLAERQKHPTLTQGEYVECFVNSKNPYILQNAPKEFTAKRLAEELYKNGILEGNEYGIIKRITHSEHTNYFSGAMRCLNSIMAKKGYDSIIYMCQDTGNTGVIVFNESQLIPVSVNGNAIEYNDLETADPNGSAFLLKFVEKLYNKNIENLDEYDIMKLAREYLKSPEGRKDKRPYLKYRPSYGKDQVETVYENAKRVFGKVYDPSGIELPWDPSKPRNGQWDMGHIPGQRYAVIHAKYVLGMMTPSEFLQWYRDPNNYRPELPSTNRGHNYE